MVTLDTDRRTPVHPRAASGIPGWEPNAIPREALLARLVDGTDASVVVVDGPPGYGKTTAVAQWAAAETRRVAWLGLSDAHNRPAVLLRDLAAAFDAADLRHVDAEPTSDDEAAMEAGLPWFASALGRTPEPFVLVLDGADHLRHNTAHTVLRVLTRHLPPGSQLVLVTRSVRDLSIGTLASRRHLLRIEIGDLAMTPVEADALLRVLGVELGGDALDVLVRRTEGWAAALAIAADTVAAAPDRDAAARGFDGAAPAMAEFLATQVLPAFDPAEIELLRAGSVLDRLCGPACDVLLDTTGSGQVLADLARRSALVARLDRTGTSYRVHELLRGTLAATLPSAGAARRRLHARASLACENQGDAAGAIVHAFRASDRARAAGLVWRAMPSSLGTQRAHDFAAWLGLWSADEIAADPQLCCSAAWSALVNGDANEVPRWVELARRGDADLVLADGTPLRSTLALLRAVVGREGLSRTLDDATLAVELDRRDDPMLTTAYSVLGAAHRLLGHRDEARSFLEEAGDLGAVLTPTIGAQCLTHLALIAVDDDRVHDAEVLLGTAHAIAVKELATERPTMTLLFAARASLAARRGDVSEASADAEQAVHLLNQLRGVMPWLAIEARILLAVAYAHLGSSRAARMAAREAEHLLGAYPDPGTLPARLRRAREVIESVQVPLGLTASRLTPAEARVLTQLPTHLSFPEIADALFVSRHTVKTHAASIYHKLGVSSRRDAVDRAAELGLLE